MKTLEHATEIDAPPEAVWAVLADFRSYAEWNPFMTLEGDPTMPGNQLTLKIRPPGRRRAMTLKPKVTEFVPGRSISWLGRLFVPRLFDGAHTLRVEPLPDGRTRFVQHETFRGVLVPFVKSVLRDTGAGFAAMNVALQERVASGVTSTGEPRPELEYLRP